ncbi:MAG: nucleotidyltransferase [Candidatus Omnitrophota bacterium]
MNKTILEKLFTVLNNLNIPYVLIGGYAAAAWGYIRATKDTDFLAAISPDKIDRVIADLKAQGFTVEYRRGDIEDPVRGLIKLGFQLQESEIDFTELVLGIKKMPSDVYLRAKKLHFAEIEIPVISPEDLIILKLIAGGPSDINDARNIYEILKEKLDDQYLGKEVKRCKLSLNSIKKTTP